MNSSKGPDRYIRVITHGRTISDIKEEIVQAAKIDVCVLVSTTEGLNDLDTEVDNRNAVIADWAEKLSQEHGLDWRRVGRDVLFTLPS